MEKKIKILITGATLPPPYGGLIKRILLHSREWIKSGCEVYLVEVFKRSHAKLSIPINVIYLITSRKKLLIEFMKCLLRYPLFSLSILLRTFQYHIKGCFKFKEVIISPVYEIKLFDILKQIKPDVVITHHAFEESYLTVHACSKLGIPVILTSYSETLFWREKECDKNIAQLYEPLFKFIFENVSHVISPSMHCAKGVLKYVPPTKVSIVYSGVDYTYDKYTQIPKNKAKELIGLYNSRIILFVGQLHWRKGPQYLAQASNSIIEKYPDVKIVFIGKDFGMKKIIEKITENYKDHILFMGSVSDEILPIYIRAADVLVFPSVTQRECMGMSIKEAMLLETPIVAFNVGGISEAILDGETGLLVELGNWKKLADNICKILQYPELSRRICKKARKLALQKFISSVTGKEELSIILNNIIKNIK